MTKCLLTKLDFHTRKHSTKVDTTTVYITYQPKQANRKTDNATTSSGTTLILVKHQYQHRTQIPCPNRQTLPQRPQAQENLQPKQHQDQLRLHGQHETNNQQQ